MKKSLISFLTLTLFIPSAMAATLVSEYSTVLDKNEVRELAPLLITSTADGDITAEHGINILLVPDQKILWNDSDLAITGTARDHGKVNLNVKPQYSVDLKSIFIPVMKDFEAGEWLTINGLTLRAYDESFNDQKLGLDLDGDLKADVQDVNPYRVGHDEKSDLVAPFPVRNALSKINSDGSVTLTWSNPPDYDFENVIIDRNVIKNGLHFTSTVSNAFRSTDFTDNDLKNVTSSTYTILTTDGSGNQSTPVHVTVDLTQPQPVTPPIVTPSTPPVPPVETTPPATTPPSSEIEALNKLLPYYYVRYSIKCLPSGVPAALNDSACLWAKIDLIYTQQLIGKEKVKGLSLSSYDKELIGSRRQWPEARYQKNCLTLASIPFPTAPAYCPALGKSLDRIGYFLD